MQLKTIGESSIVVKTIDNIISKTSAMSKSMSGFKLQTAQLVDGLNGYSTETAKTAISSVASFKAFLILLQNSSKTSSSYLKMFLSSSFKNSALTSSLDTCTHL